MYQNKNDGVEIMNQSRYEQTYIKYFVFNKI